jgi:hypothetical protein
LSHSSSPFCFGYFAGGISWTVCPAGLELKCSESQSPRWLGLQEWVTGAWLVISIFKFKFIYSFIFI